MQNTLFLLAFSQINLNILGENHLLLYAWGIH